MRRTSLSLVFCAMATWVLAACAMAPTTALEPPIVHLSDFRVGDVSLFEQRYVLALRVENPNPYEMPIKGMAYQVLLNKAELGRGTSAAEVTIPPYGERVVEVSLISNAFSLLKRVQEISSGAMTDGITLSINGKANVANRPEPIPFNFKS